MDRSQKIRSQYEQWPYPDIPMIGSVRRADTWQINLRYLADRCGVEMPPLRPRILIVGCGTFQPYVFALANPNADILATDISKKSLDIARYRNILHGMTNVHYQLLDLNRPETYPDGPFDYIECYGVLMNLNDPSNVLTELVARLSKNGIVRVMVYPYFSRQRIFQIQRLARILGLHHQDRSHPALLRRIMLSLPVSHPLRYAFITYRDAENLAGIVDGFLHAGDRGFTGHQLGGLIDQAGLKPAFYFHRPWGQPHRMANALGLADSTQSFILHYLDLWQELRTNFIICLTRKGSTSPVTDPPLELHPVLTLRTGSLLHRLKMLGHHVAGITLSSRTEEEPIYLSGGDLRALSRGDMNDAVLIKKAAEYGLLLGGSRPPINMPAYRSDFQTEPVLSIEIGSNVPNPFYHAIFKAYTFSRDDRSDGVGLADEITRWQPLADPLEEEGAFGLTPFGTYTRFSKEILDYVARGHEKETVSRFDQVRFKGDEAGRKDVLSFLKSYSLPRNDWNEAELRELWILLFSYPQLFLESSEITG